MDFTCFFFLSYVAIRKYEVKYMAPVDISIGQRLPIIFTELFSLKPLGDTVSPLNWYNQCNFLAEEKSLVYTGMHACTCVH